MYGVDGPFVNNNQIRGVLGDELPWEIGRVSGSLGKDGRLNIDVKGLVFANDPSVPINLRGINDEDTFRALVSCLSEGAGDQITTVNITTGGFKATKTGDSHIHTRVQLPKSCVAPIIFILSGRRTSGSPSPAPRRESDRKRFVRDGTAFYACRKERSDMLMALALLAAIDAVPSCTVSLTLSGETDRPPVSAARRSLSDVARELRAGRKAVASFSAAESTLPQSRIVFVPMFESEPVEAEPEPEVVPEVQPVYIPNYVPVWFGGRQKVGHLHRRHAAHLSAPGAAPPLPGRTFSPPRFRPRQTSAGISRER